MAFLDNNKFKEILEASRNGNEKAKIIMQAMRKNDTQDDLNRLVDDYYNLATDTETNSIEEEPVADVEEVSVKIESAPEQEVLEPEVIDLSEILDKETDGLFDENEYKTISFADFLRNRKTDNDKATKNRDYFRTFDVDGKAKYMSDKISAYKAKFDGDIKDIERSYNDLNKAILGYSQIANDQLDDEVEFDQVKTTGAYNDFIGNDTVMHSFGRYWDDDDMKTIEQAIRELIEHYGKKNVVAVLNLLKNDNEQHRDYLNNEIDQNITKYSRSIEKLLK